jgi:hypothetical protein
VARGWMQILEELEEKYAPHGPEVKTLSQSVASNPSAARYAAPSAFAPWTFVRPFSELGQCVHKWMLTALVLAHRLALPPALLEKLPEPAADASVKTMSEPAPLRSDSAEGKRAHFRYHQGRVEPAR